MRDVIDHAASLGLGVKFEELGRRTAEIRANRVILVNKRRVPSIQRMAIAHECGHWFHGHDWTRDHDRPRDERQADVYAARLLISPAEYRDAERVAGPHVGALARELNVTVLLVNLWRESYLAEVGVVRRMPTRAAG